MISLYFGLPGCGKTTMFAKLALDASRSKRYKHVYGNVSLSGIKNYTQITADMLGQYDLSDCLILIDEATVYFDNRDYKNFNKKLREWVLLHRHFRADLCLFAQSFGAVDKTFRVLCDRCYYIFKGFWTGHFRSIVWRIPYGIVIPSKKDTGADKYGDIVEGYYKPDLLSRLLTPNLYRKKYYQYFDSWERPELPPLPDDVLLKQMEHNKSTLNQLTERTV